MFESFDTFHLNAKFFPESTKKALSTAAILQHGALPLGYKSSLFFFKKSKTLNLGFLNPEKVGNLNVILEECKKALGDKAFTHTQVYRLKPEEFIETLDLVYHIKKEALLKVPKESLDSTLKNFLET